MQNRRDRQASKGGVRVVVYSYMLLILLLLLVVASYTWFSISATPRVSDMNVFVNASGGLELSLDPTAADWRLQLDLRDIISTSAPLRPVTWLDSEQRFYAAAYGPDGRMLPFSYWHALTDDRNANKDTIEGYYIHFTLYARSGTKADVSLSPAVEVDEGIHGAGTYLIGSPVWNSDTLRHDNGGLGAESAIRIGLAITPVDAAGQPTNAESVFYVYEPNCDSHTDGSTGYVTTYNMEGATGLVDEARLIRQTSSTWTESNPVQRDVVIRDLGDFLDTPTLFSLAAGDMVQMDVYVWLEGQDVDCTSLIRDAQLMANLQLRADTGNQSGMEPIE